MVLSIVLFHSDKGVNFDSRLLSEVCVGLAQDILGIVLPASLSPDDEVLDGFPYLGLTFLPTELNVVSVFAMVLHRGKLLYRSKNI